jgi:Zn-dependent protease
MPCPPQRQICYSEAMPSDYLPDDPLAEVKPVLAPPGVTYEPADEVVRAELSDPEPAARPRTFKRRLWLPVMLFVLTCGSTFFSGATGFMPLEYLLLKPFTESLVRAEPHMEALDFRPLRGSIYSHWREGLIYMACVLAILMTHEMGHFVMTLIYRVRASLPYFIPLPFSPIGTMGAVIVMDSRTADRREIFDIGLAGPIAGLIVAVPIMLIGIGRMDLTPPASGQGLGLPLALRMGIAWAHPGQFDVSKGFELAQADPFFMAGWVGLLVTGLNMLPVSQLDGGHVTYALFGRAAHWVARGFMVLAFTYMAVMFMLYSTPPTFMLMAILVLFIGTDHPPTSNDRVPLGWFRTALGYASLLIPVFCLVPSLQV